MRHEAQINLTDPLNCCATVLGTPCRFTRSLFMSMSGSGWMCVRPHAPVRQGRPSAYRCMLHEGV